LLAHRVVLLGSPYLDSASVARELRGQEQWDPQTQVWRLTAGSHDLRLAPQMPVALMDGVPQSLRAPPLMEQGRLVLPEKLWTEHLFRWKVSAPPPLPGVGSRLRVITVDAGHGGHDPGASGRLGLKEKTVPLDVARRLADLLRRDGFQVILTRSDDRFIPLPGRFTPMLPGAGRPPGLRFIICRRPPTTTPARLRRLRTRPFRKRWATATRSPPTAKRSFGTCCTPSTG
jgi:hypothetical protein